jgi:hypothetical protein
MKTFVFYVPTLDSPNEATVDDEVTTLPFGKSESAMAMFSYNQKVAQYLREYILFMFSEYLSENNIREISDDAIKRFVKDVVVIDGDAKYTIRLSAKTFEENKQTFTRDGKLMIKSKELLLRLVYCLRIDVIQRHQEVFGYHKRVFIAQVNVDTNDFEVHPQQIILEGEDALERYITEPTAVHQIRDSIFPTSKYPYFLRNEFLGDNKIYLATNAETIDDVLTLSKTPRSIGTTSVLFPDMYTYSSPVDIKLVGQFKNSPEKVLVYNIDDVQYYVVLKEFV